jgi:flagellar motility protein MotE (MotC chaperone)
MKTSKGRKNSGKGKLTGLLVPMLVLCLVVKTLLVSFYLYQRLEKISWPSLAQAASDDNTISELQTPPAAETIGLTELFAKKEQQLRLKEEELKQKEAGLLLLKQEVSAKLAELTALQQKVADDLDELKRREKAQQDNRIKKLGEMYKAMEPARAAKLMERLDEHIAVKIIAKMRGRAAGEILAGMELNKAAQISRRLSESSQ